MARILPASDGSSPATCTIIPFPHSRRIGRARAVAASLARKTTNAARASYENQVRDGLEVRWENLGLPDGFAAEWSAFWTLVQCEIARIERKGGGA